MRMFQQRGVLHQGLWVWLFLTALVTMPAQAGGRIADVILVARDSAAVLPMYSHAGRRYVEGAPGDGYEIRVRNNTGAEILAVVAVDGLNVITGQPASPRQSGYVVPAWGETRIRGWRKNLEGVAGFYFTELTNSYAARVGRPENVGVIGVGVFRKRERFDDFAGESQAPPSASASEKGRARAESRLGTGHGEWQNAPVVRVPFERATRDPEEVIRLFYDSRENLMAQGIVVHRPREFPDPFPGGFVADPPAY